jgi:hypothetical protein
MADLFTKICMPYAAARLLHHHLVFIDYWNWLKQPLIL